MFHSHSLLHRASLFLVPTALVLIFGASAWEVAEDRLLAIDQLAASLAAALPVSVAVPLGQALSALPRITAPILLFWLLFHRKRREALLVEGTSAAALAMAEILKLVFLRPRPEMMLAAATNASFPSGHTTVAFAVAMACALLWLHEHAGRGRKVPALLIASAILVGAGRIILGVHLASDVIAGAAFGTLVSWLGYQLFSGAGRRTARAFSPGQKGHAWSA